MSADRGFRNSKQFRKELDAAPAREGVYLFLGEEEGEKDKFIQMLTERLIPGEEERRTSSMIFHLEDGGDLGAAAEYTVSQSMFSSAKVCVIRSIEKMQRGGNSPELFREMIESRSPGTTVIMTSVEPRPPAFVDKTMLDGMTVVQFWRLFDDDIRRYIAVSMRRHQIEIDDEAVEQLLEFTGRDIKKIDEAIDAVRYSGEAGPVTAGMIRNFVFDVRSVSVFDFCDRLFLREKGCLHELKKLVDEGTPDLLILSMIMKEAEAMERYIGMVRKGAGQDEALRAAGVPQRKADVFLRRMKKLSGESLERLFGRIFDADRAIKSGGGGKGLLVNPLFELAAGFIMDGEVTHPRKGAH